MLYLFLITHELSHKTLFIMLIFNLNIAHILC